MRFVRVAWIMGRHGALFVLDPLARSRLSLRLLVALISMLAPTRRTFRKMEKGKRLVEALQALGPAYIKLGQTFATRPDLIGETIADELTLLQDRLPPEDGDAMVAVIERELGGPLDKFFRQFDRKAVAAASIAQVHFATTRDGRKVAVKVLRPGIEHKMARDFKSFAWGAALVESTFKKARRLKLEEAVNMLYRKVEIELDLRMEAAAASELRENMAGEPGYRVPEMDWSRTAERVMTMERVGGIPLKQIRTANGKYDRKKISATLVRVFLTQALRDGFFHGDWHQGNFFIEPDGTVVPVDFGIMGRLDQDSRRYLAEILWGFHERDYQRVADIHFEAGYVPKDQSRALFAQAMRALVEPIMGKPLKEISLANMLMQLFRTTETFNMQTQPQLLTLQRSMMMMEGLALLVDPDANMWELSDEVIERWVRKMTGTESRVAELVAVIREVLRLLPQLVRSLREAMSEMEARVRTRKGG